MILDLFSRSSFAPTRKFRNLVSLFSFHSSITNNTYSFRFSISVWPMMTVNENQCYIQNTSSGGRTGYEKPHTYSQVSKCSLVIQFSFFNNQSHIVLVFQYQFGQMMKVMKIQLLHTEQQFWRRVFNFTCFIKSFFILIFLILYVHSHSNAYSTRPGVILYHMSDPVPESAGVFAILEEIHLHTWCALRCESIRTRLRYDPSQHLLTLCANL